MISDTEAQRIPEIGARLALGATPSRCCRLAVGHGPRLSIVGVALGLTGALPMARLLKPLPPRHAIYRLAARCGSMR